MVLKKILNETVRRKIYLVLFPIALIILELMPGGVVMKFSGSFVDGKIGYNYHSYSYFDLMPFLYVDFGPLLTAILSVAILVFLTVYFVNQRSTLLTVALCLSFIAFLSSLITLFYEIESFTLIGGFISALLILLSLSIIFLTKK